MGQPVTAFLFSADPAVVLAMSHCLAARSMRPDRPVTPSHPRPCGWEDYSLGELRAAVDEFNDWAGYEKHHATRAFAELPPADREALVVAAQAFPDEPATTRATNPPPELELAIPIATDVATDRTAANDGPSVSDQSPVATAVAEIEEDYLPWKR